MRQSFKLAVKNIWGNKMRSFLTMLGIIIGVASVITLVGLVEGQMSYIKASFEDMGTNQIQVSLTNTATRFVDAERMYSFYEENRAYFKEISPKLSLNMTLKHNTDKLKNTRIFGVSEQYRQIDSVKMEAGRFLQYSDIVSRQPVCVLGYYTATRLFGSPKEALGQMLRMDGNLVKVVGVAARKNKEEQKPGGIDDRAYLPYTTAVYLLKNSNIDSYVLTTVDTEQTMEAKNALTGFLMGVYKTADLFYVDSMSELLKSMNSTMAMMSATLGGIAGISLLVAGVGVMNIMLVSVTERTREIGIRKSLGAKKSVILQQFVIESAVTSSLGGVIGIVIGCAAVPALGTLMKMKAVPSLRAILISFGVSVLIGLIFGYMPAKRAASLNPIDALRSE